MGKLPSPDKLNNRTTAIFSGVKQAGGSLGRWLNTLRQKIWTWMRLHIPFIEAFVQRHIQNPSTVFIDLAAFVLALYVIFGATGAILLYGKKSESRFTEVLTQLYPLPAARVNSSFIWGHEYLQRLRFLNTFNSQAPSSVTSRPPTDKDLRTQIMQGLVENQVLVLQANKLGISVTSAEVDSAYSAQKAQTPDLDTKINQLYGMSVADFKAVLAEKILKQKVTAAVLEEAHVSHILTTSLDAATKAKQDIAAGKSFTDAAKEYSQDSQTKDSGGDLGFWSKGQLASQIGQNFEDTAFKQPLNQVSDPIQTKFGYHLILVTERTGTNYESYDDWYSQTLKDYTVAQYIAN